MLTKSLAVSYRNSIGLRLTKASSKRWKEGFWPDIRLPMCRCSWYDGSYHSVDSSEMAFKIAGSLAFKKAAPEAGMVLLEPIMNMVITVNKDNVGDIMGDLNSRRGRVMGMDSGPKGEEVTAQVPLAEIQTYANELTSMTGGLGAFTIEFSHYEEVPAQITEKIVAARNAE